jgi:hypothetical protein
MHLDNEFPVFIPVSTLFERAVMPRVNRREIFSETDVQVFQTISRCVRRNHLCGRDRRSERDFSHRREWIRSRLEELAGIFAIETLGYALMANHMHLVIRTRPDIAATWSDDEVARRLWNLFPQRRTPTGLPEQPTPEELNHLKNSPAGIADRRRRLTSVSWFMKCISEPIAKRANREDEVPATSGKPASRLSHCSTNPPSPPAWPTSISTPSVPPARKRLKPANSQASTTASLIVRPPQVLVLQPLRKLRPNTAPAPAGLPRSLLNLSASIPGTATPLAAFSTAAACSCRSINTFSWSTGLAVNCGWTNPGRSHRIWNPSSRGLTAASKPGWILSKTFVDASRRKPADRKRCRLFHSFAEPADDPISEHSLGRDPGISPIRKVRGAESF